MPYTEEEVTFTNDDISLAGTLTVPEKSGRHPAVILISGSGPVNRDQEAFGMKPFRMIADHFASKGIAVLRYDSRGVGSSTGDSFQATTADFTRDILAAIDLLKARDDVDPEQIGLCGQSEGGLIGPLVASQSDEVAYVICMAGPVLPGMDGFLAQNAWVARADGASEDQIEDMLAVERRLLDIVIDGAETDRLEPLLLQKARMLTALQPAQDNTEKAAKSHADCMLGLYTSPWFRFFLEYDPAPALQKVKCPMLLLYGGLDTQVPTETNRLVMVSILKAGMTEDYTIKVFPQANHLFITAQTGSPSEYERLHKEFVPGFLDSMSDWILERVDTIK